MAEQRNRLNGNVSTVAAVPMIDSDISSVSDRTVSSSWDGIATKACAIMQSDESTTTSKADMEVTAMLQHDFDKELLSRFCKDTTARDHASADDHPLDYHQQPISISAQDAFLLSAALDADNTVSRNTAEVYTYPEDRPLVPNRFDVIFGRGAPIRNFPGNEPMRRMIEEHAVRYYHSTKCRKGRIVEEIIEKVGSAVRERSENGTFRRHDVRFLKHSGGRYQIADAETIRLKVRKSMTNYINKHLKQPVADVKQAPVSKRKRDGDDDDNDKKTG